MPAGRSEVLEHCWILECRNYRAYFFRMELKADLTHRPRASINKWGKASLTQWRPEGGLGGRFLTLGTKAAWRSGAILICVHRLQPSPNVCGDHSSSQYAFHSKASVSSLRIEKSSKMLNSLIKVAVLWISRSFYMSGPSKVLSNIYITYEKQNYQKYIWLRITGQVRSL